MPVVSRRPSGVRADQTLQRAGRASRSSWFRWWPGARPAAERRSVIHAMAKQTQFDLALEHAMNAAAKEKDVTKLPPPVRTLALVHAAQGVIDNGGLQYFFESDFPGEPDYALFVEAYRAIGADDAATTLERAVALFPFGAPHKHVKKRNEFLDSFLDEDEQPVNSPFQPLTAKLCGNRSVWEKLKKYVAGHLADFGGRG